MKAFKKPRGLARKSQSMMRRIAESTAHFPAPHPGYSYWHTHLPSTPDFADAAATPLWVRRLCVQTLIDRVHHLSALAPRNVGEVRVAAIISLSDLWTSQIVVCWEPKYFDGFFDSDEQRWAPLESKRSLRREWNVELPPTLSERGFVQRRREGETRPENELWFVGNW